MRLTPQGAQLHAGLRAAYIQIERTLEDVRRTGSLGGGVLRAGFSTTLPEKVRAELIDAFEGRYPDCRVVASGMPTNGRDSTAAATGRPTTPPTCSSPICAPSSVRCARAEVTYGRCVGVGQNGCRARR